MATLTNLVKIETDKKLSEKDEKELVKLKKKSIQESKKLNEFLSIISNPLTNTVLKDINAAEDISYVQSKIYSALFKNFSESINAYSRHIISLKKSGYFLPDLAEIPFINLIEKDTTFIGEGGHWYRRDEKRASRKEIRKDNKDWMTGLNNYKKFNYKNIVELMEKLGFVIMPFEFLSDTAFSVDKDLSENTIKSKISSFKTAISTVMESNYEYYILSPIKYLDLMKWAKCKDISKTVTFASSLGNISLNINMSMPLFRSLFGSVEMLAKRVDNVEGKIASMEEEIKQFKEQQKLLGDNIKLLQGQLDNIKTEMISRIESVKAEQGELNERVKSLEAWRIACMTDPLIFAKNGDSCYIGFSWGPEFPEDVLKEFGISVYK